ncbi:MAG: ADP-ribose diphosphatase [Beggiatoa sp. IS2]|nr:MAG: ADP-ribose diphosphatase [Beggiatoa sp. IS2]
MTTTDSQEKSFEILDRTVAYAGYFQIVHYRLRHTLFAGGWSGEIVREVFERGHAAGVLPYDPVRDTVVLIQQFRIGAIDDLLREPKDAWLWEIVAGIIEEGESAYELAHREAQEEAGCTLLDTIPMYSAIVSPGGSTETIALFCGRVDSTQIGGIHGLAEEHEDIRVQVFPFDEALEMLRSRKIRSCSTIIAMQWLALRRETVRKRWLNQKMI